MQFVCFFFLITSYCIVLGHGPSPGPGPKLVPVLGPGPGLGPSPGPVIFLVPALVPVPVPNIWSRHTVPFAPTSDNCAAIFAKVLLTFHNSN